jgi:hypothetical protein
VADESLQQQTGEVSQPVDSKQELETYIVDINENIIKKLDKYEERDKFTYEIIDTFMKFVADLKGKIDQSKLNQPAVIGKDPFEVLLNGLRDAEIPLGEARKIVGIKGEMTGQCHKKIVSAIKILENILKKVREPKK